jgi:hypothetical protein
MIRRSIFLVAVLILGLLVSSACSSDDDAVTPGMRAAGTITGRIFDVASGDPLGNVVVRISSMPYEVDVTGTGQIIRETATDGDGYFTRTDIPNGFIEVKVSKDGYRTPESQFWSLSPGGTGEFRFDMAPGEDPVPEFEGDEQWARPPEWEDQPEEDY